MYFIKFFIFCFYIIRYLSLKVKEIEKLLYFINNNRRSEKIIGKGVIIFSFINKFFIIFVY